jgi:hypothetical protein
MHETSSPYHVGADRNHHFSSETFSANGVVTPYTLFWHIGSCIMLSPIRTCRSMTHPPRGRPPTPIKPSCRH